MTQDFVGSIADIEQNIRTWTEYRNSANNVEKEFYVKRVINGARFVMYYVEGVAHFAPSRFVGRVANRQDDKDGCDGKDDRAKNAAITQILGEPDTNDIYETLYHGFCQELRLAPKRQGAPGNERKFWTMPAATPDDVAEAPEPA